MHNTQHNVISGGYFVGSRATVGIGQQKKVGKRKEAKRNPKEPVDRVRVGAVMSLAKTISTYILEREYLVRKDVNIVLRMKR